MYGISYVGRRCKPLRKPINAVCNGNLTSVPTDTIVKCSCTEESGRRFVNGLRQMSIMCSSSGNWTESDINCIRKNNQQINVFYCALVSVFLFTDVCDVMPVVDNALLRPITDEYITMGANVTCNPGHRFQDGRQTHEVMCDVTNGMWPNMEECRGINTEENV